MEFSNAQLLKDRSPEIFYAPEIEDLRTNAKPGDFVKVCGNGKPGEYSAERIWIEITHLDGDTIAGTVSSDPVDHPLKYGDSISVNIDEVYQHVSERPR